MGTFLVMVAATLLAQSDPYRGRCSQAEEAEVVDCNGGKKEVWHFAFKELDREAIRSWPYKSQQRAQQALENDRDLCQAVDRYWHHVDCRTAYSEVFCAACGPVDPGLDWLKADLSNASLVQLETWNEWLAGALVEIRSLERSGQPAGARPIFGRVMKEYVRQLRDASLRVREIQKILNQTSNQGSRLSREIELLGQSLADARAAHVRFRAAFRELPTNHFEERSRSESGAHERSTGGTVAGADSSATFSALTDRCTVGLPDWAPVCDLAVDALFARARAKQASAADLDCLKTWRSYHQCIGVYAHDRHPDPAPTCVRPSCNVSP